MNQASNKLFKGFTLIELIVVMAVFLFVIGAAIGIFLSIIQNQRKVLAEQQLLSQISYTEEYMSKALRMAITDTSKTDPSGNCLPSGYIYLFTHRDGNSIYRGIKFLNQSDTDSNGYPICEEFYWDATPGGLFYQVRGVGSAAVPLTASNLQINSANFSINGFNGSASGQGCGAAPDQCGALGGTSAFMQPQPRVTVLLNVNIPSVQGEAIRTIQTTISQRNLNTQ